MHKTPFKICRKCGSSYGKGGGIMAGCPHHPVVTDYQPLPKNLKRELVVNKIGILPSVGVLEGIAFRVMGDLSVQLQTGQTLTGSNGWIKTPFIYKKI